MKAIFKKCEKCNGDGFTAEHDEGFGSHDVDGSCIGNCPVQVQCNECRAVGFIEIDQATQIEQLEKDKEELEKKLKLEERLHFNQIKRSDKLSVLNDDLIKENKELRGAVTKQQSFVGDVFRHLGISELVFYDESIDQEYLDNHNRINELLKTKKP
jgi:hypothetical protein